MGDASARLAPVGVEEEGRPAYLPRMPWRFLVLAGVLGLGVLAMAALRDRVEVAAAKRQLIGLHANRLGVHAQRHHALRPTLAALARRSLVAEPGAAPVASALLERLRSAPGLHARIAYDADPRAPLASLRSAGAALPSCLGAEAVALDAYLPRARALLVDPLRAASRDNDAQTLRVMQHQLAVGIERDGALVRAGAWARWVLFAVERDATASRVDLFLWDVPSQRLLADATARGDGVLLTARIAEAPRMRPAAGASTRPVALDCSLAAALKARLGQRVPEVQASAAQIAVPRPAG